MIPHLLRWKTDRGQSSITLENGSRVAVIGGGPAGSFFSYFFLDLAQRVGLDAQLEIYEPRDFSLPAPQGCNMCAGVISETLVQNLATEGINLPPVVVQKAVDSYTLHTDFGNQCISSGLDEKRIGIAFRGAGPHGNQDANLGSFDDHILSLARERGARVIHKRVTGVERFADHLQVKTRNDPPENYNLVVIATGVNTGGLKFVEDGPSAYSAPKTAKTAIREYYLGKDLVEKHFGGSLHIFMLNIPRLDIAMIIPKGPYVSVSLLGKDIDEDLLHAFLSAPEVKKCFPEGWRWDEVNCQCMPRIQVRPAVQPYADRVVYIGDSGVSRVYKDGIGAAYRAAKAAATCTILEGISAETFERFYGSFTKKMSFDNYFGRFIFFVTHLIQSTRFARKALLRLMTTEQQAPCGSQRMCTVLWDAFTGSSPYLNIFLRTLHPMFLGRFIWNLIVSV